MPVRARGFTLIEIMVVVVILAILGTLVAPQILGRIDEVIMFHGLTRENIEHIATIQIKKLEGLLAARRLKLEISPAARKAVIDAGYQPQFGARPLRRAIQRMLQDPLSMAVLEGGFVDDDTILAVLANPEKPEEGLKFQKKGVDVTSAGPGLAPGAAA